MRCIYIYVSLGKLIETKNNTSVKLFYFFYISTGTAGGIRIFRFKKYYQSQNHYISLPSVKTNSKSNTILYSQYKKFIPIVLILKNSHDAHDERDKKKNI